MINFWSCSVKYILFSEFRIFKLKGIYIYAVESCFTDIPAIKGLYKQQQKQIAMGFVGYIWIP